MVKDPAGLTLTEVAGALRRRTFSSTELTRWMLERIGRWQPAINAFVRVEEDEALAAAKRADRALARGRAKGALYGVPLAHKDMYTTISDGGLPDCCDAQCGISYSGVVGCNSRVERST